MVLATKLVRGHAVLTFLFTELKEQRRQSWRGWKCGAVN